MTAHPLDSDRGAQRATRRVALIGVAALFIAAGVVGVVQRSGVASAAPEGAVGCGYGTGGPFADTLCWIDMSDFDHGLATGAGQQMSAELPGGYTVSFTVHASGDHAVAASAFPTWTFGDGEGAAVGNWIYLDTPGEPALYQVGGGGNSSTVELEDIEVTDIAGNSVGGWRLVGVDAEATAANESITFSADVPVSVLATYDRDGAATNGCQMDIEQIDANTIRCRGANIDTDVYGTLLVSADTPTSFSQTMTVDNQFAREGVAFAIQTSTIELDAQILNRVDESDTFTLDVVSPEDAVVGEAETGAAITASTGQLVVLPRVDGSAYTLRITPGPGTDLDGYSIRWECARDGVDAPSLSAEGVDAIEVSPSAGEEVACTVYVAVGGTDPGGGGTAPASPVAGNPSFTG